LEYTNNVFFYYKPISGAGIRILYRFSLSIGTKDNVPPRRRSLSRLALLTLRLIEQLQQVFKKLVGAKELLIYQQEGCLVL
jgi:hypothetical protein